MQVAAARVMKVNRLSEICIQISDMFTRLVSEIVNRKPCLREIPFFEIVRRTRPAHLRCSPPGIDGSAQHVGPTSCDGERKCSQIELAV